MCVEASSSVKTGWRLWAPTEIKIYKDWKRAATSTGDFFFLGWTWKSCISLVLTSQRSGFKVTPNSVLWPAKQLATLWLWQKKNEMISLCFWLGQVKWFFVFCDWEWMHRCVRTNSKICGLMGGPNGCPGAPACKRGNSFFLSVFDRLSNICFLGKSFSSLSSNYYR